MGRTLNHNNMPRPLIEFSNEILLCEDNCFILLNTLIIYDSIKKIGNAFVITDENSILSYQMKKYQVLGMLNRAYEVYVFYGENLQEIIDNEESPHEFIKTLIKDLS